MRINPLVVPVLVVSLLLGSVLTTQQLGLWSTSGRATVNLERIAPADVKGWMTLQQVIEGVPIPKDDLYRRANIPADLPPTTALKEIEKIVAGFETTTVRDALIDWQRAVGQAALPVPTALSVPVAPIAVATLQAGPALTPDQIKGTHTLGQVAEQAHVPIDALVAMLKLPIGTDVNVTIKDMIAQGRVTEVTAVRDAVTVLQAR